MYFESYVLGGLFLIACQFFFFTFYTFPRIEKDLFDKIDQVNSYIAFVHKKLDKRINQSIENKITNATGHYLTDIYTSCIDCGSKMKQEEGIDIDNELAGAFGGTNKDILNYVCSNCLRREIKVIEP